jgi:5-amino-6-(5-phospho-D-ribitylamino)uracil phosphatase|tara:strand:- start:19 stop:894 length:876 start_codon:yes stop_codon:yes gene_type:complete
MYSHRNLKNPVEGIFISNSRKKLSNPSMCKKLMTLKSQIKLTCVEDSDRVLYNPLVRLEELGTRYFGVIVDFEGVIDSPNFEYEREAWRTLAVEENLKEPTPIELKKAEGMKFNDAICQVFCWTRDPQRIESLLKRRRGILTEQNIEARRGGARLESFTRLCTLFHTWKIPVAIVSSSRIRESLELELKKLYKQQNRTIFLVGSDDFAHSLPDIDSFTTAAEILSRPLQRCVVISNSIFSIEAAKDLQMKCVIISDRFKAWELHEADIIVKDLEELTFQRFQSLFAAETEN